MATTADRREYRRQYYLAHREQEIERQLKYYYEHREQQNECHRQYYYEHREQHNEYNRKWNAEHREQCNEYARKYRESHREQISAQKKLHRKKQKLAKKLGLVSVNGKFNTPEQVKSTVTVATAPIKKHYAEVYTRSDRATRHEQLMARRDKFRDFVGETLAEYDYQKSVQQYERSLERSRKYHAKKRLKEVDR